MSCRLRRLQEPDLTAVMHWRMLPEVTSYMYTDPVLTADSQKAWFERLQASSDEQVWIIELTATREAVGTLSISNIDQRHRRCSWAYYIGNQAAKGKGLAKLLEYGVYNHAFSRMGMNKVYCEVLAFNQRVIDLHLKYGATIEGTLRQHIWKNGLAHDVVQMSILKSEWEVHRRDTDAPFIDIE